MFSCDDIVLQTGVYSDWDEFHGDMLLVRDNCHMYNPPGHEVRRDCDEVFGFYLTEYDKTLDRWQKVCILMAQYSLNK